MAATLETGYYLLNAMTGPSVQSHTEGQDTDSATKDHVRQHSLEVTETNGAKFSVVPSESTIESGASPATPRHSNIETDPKSAEVERESIPRVSANLLFPNSDSVSAFVVPAHASDAEQGLQQDFAQHRSWATKSRIIGIMVLIASMALVSIQVIGQHYFALYKLATAIEHLDSSRVKHPLYVAKEPPSLDLLYVYIGAGLLGLYQVRGVAILLRRVVNPVSAIPESHSENKTPGATKGDDTQKESLIGKLKMMKHHFLSIDSTWFWRIQGIKYLMTIVFQLELVSTYGGWSILSNTRMGPVQDWPIIVVHSFFLCLHVSMCPMLSLQDQRVAIMIFSCVRDIGFSLDRLLLIKPFPGTDATDPRNWYLFRFQHPLEFVSTFLPILGVSKDIMGINEILDEQEQSRLQRRESDAAPANAQMQTPERENDSTGLALADIGAAVGADETPTEKAPPSRSASASVAMDRRQAVIRSAPLICVAIAFFVFILVQTCATSCPELHADTCKWVAHPIWSFPACGCHVTVEPTVDVDTGECLDYAREIVTKKADSIYLYLQDTPFQHRECAVSDEGLYEVLRGVPRLRTLIAQHQRIQLAEQERLLPQHDNLEALQLWQNDVQELTVHLKLKFPKLQSLAMEYNAISHIDAELIAYAGPGREVNKLLLAGNPICAAQPPELQALVESHDGSKCEIEVVEYAKEQVNATATVCGNTAESDIEYMALLHNFQSLCKMHQETPLSVCNHECDTLTSLVAAVDGDGDGYLNLDEANSIIPIYLGRRFRDQTEYECTIAALECQVDDPVQDRMHPAVVLIGITGDLEKSVPGTDCSECQPL